MAAVSVDPATCEHLILRRVIITTPDKPLYQCEACFTLFKVPEAEAIVVKNG